jgi:hypothetical protein
MKRPLEKYQHYTRYPILRDDVSELELNILIAYLARDLGARVLIVGLMSTAADCLLGFTFRNFCERQWGNSFILLAPRETIPEVRVIHRVITIHMVKNIYGV